MLITLHRNENFDKQKTIDSPKIYPYGKFLEQKGINPKKIWIYVMMFPIYIKVMVQTNKNSFKYSPKTIHKFNQLVSRLAEISEG